MYERCLNVRYHVQTTIKEAGEKLHANIQANYKVNPIGDAIITFGITTKA
jgi:hypothetical protein